MNVEISVAADVKEAVALLAVAWQVSEGEVVRRLVDRVVVEYTDQLALPAGGPVPLYAVYLGTRVTGLYHPDTSAVTVTSPPCEGQRFRRPSPAAIAVVAALNPDITKPVVNGWLFWRITATDYVLDTRRTWRGRIAHVPAKPG